MLQHNKGRVRKDRFSNSLPGHPTDGQTTQAHC
jgi:hypothetical protein